LTDTEADWIIRNIITPQYKKNDYQKGIEEGAEAIMKEISGENVTGSNSSSSKIMDIIGANIPTIFLFGLALISSFISWIGSIFARTKSWHLGGIVGGALGAIIGLIIFNFFAFLIFSGLFGALGAILDYAVSTKYKQAKKSGNHIPWWAGGGSPGGRSSGGFSGFGGGSFGGGGSSGDW